MKDASAWDMKRFAVAVLFFLALVWSRPAAAHSGLASLGDEQEQVLVGVESGYVAAGETEGFMVGTEATWVRSRNLMWWGVLSQVRYESPLNNAALAVGIEGGGLMFGGDVSAIVHLGQDNAIGVRARGCMSLLVIGLCAGGTMSTRGLSPEIAGTLKVPIQLKGKYPLL